MIDIGALSTAVRGAATVALKFHAWSGFNIECGQVTSSMPPSKNAALRILDHASATTGEGTDRLGGDS